ncbi:MAG: peptidoglycan binding domain-containing protein, partial [Bacteroidales bacterium]|nr:peptidoglycan binding domain-containing protein [Bacteroidales bacterium]
MFVKKALLHEEMSVDVSSCYSDAGYSWEMLKVLLLWDKISEFQECGIVYDMGDKKIPISKEITSKWILLNEDGTFALDEKGNLQLDEAAIEAFVDELCQTYNTYDTAREFQTTRGDIILIEKGSYGTRINKEAELTYLKEAFLNKVTEE